jgi:signal transduction histidine kinase
MGDALVLVIDDDAGVRAAVVAAVGGEFDLRACASIAEAERIVATETVAVALVDEHLGPGQMSGLDYLAALAQRLPDCYRVLFSGDDAHELLVAAINRGHVDAFLPKPCRRQQFLTLFRHGVGTAKLRRDNRLLLRQLAERNAELEQAANRLERSVAERTAHLEQATAQLHEKHRELVRLETQSTVAHLVRGLAHELNNPLAAILGYAQRLQRRFGEDRETHGKLEVIVSEVDRCRTLVEQLRRLAAPLDEDLVRCNAEHLLQQAAQRLAEAGRRAPACTVVGSVPAVLGAPRSLGRVLEQVLDNAVQAGARTCVLSSGSMGDRVQLHLDNDGETPPEAVVANAVKPFFTTRSTTGGRGLGLTIAASLLRDQSGTIAIDRRPGAAGARVTITLPRASSPSDRLPSVAHTPKRPLVLVVDDEPLIAELLQDCLIDAGCDASTVATCADALAAFQSRPPRAVLADVNLADGSGVDLLRRMLALRPELAGHLALVTGDAQAHADLARSSGFPVLAKPFRLERMAEFIAALL